MRVFITGATGFVGSRLVERLLRNGEHQVAVLMRPDSDPWRIAELLPKLTVISGDLAQPAALEQPLASFAPDRVAHLAWEGVLNRLRNDTRQWRNITRSLELIELSRQLGVRHWIGLGSQAEYGPCANRIDEQTATRPTTLYGAAKLGTCLMAERLCAELSLRFAWLRLFSSYGPRDHPEWMIPYLILTLLQGKRPAVTLGEQRWDYIFVDDVAEALHQVLLHPEAQGVFNLGSGRVDTIREIIEHIRDRIDPRLPVGFGEVPYRPDQVMHLEANIERLQQATGWSPDTALDEGLAKTVEWYREHLSNYLDP